VFLAGFAQASASHYVMVALGWKSRHMPTRLFRMLCGIGFTCLPCVLPLSCRCGKRRCFVGYDCVGRVSLCTTVCGGGVRGWKPCELGIFRGPLLRGIIEHQLHCGGKSAIRSNLCIRIARNTASSSRTMLRRPTEHIQGTAAASWRTSSRRRFLCRATDIYT
jgi:hypothetical protein